MPRQGRPHLCALRVPCVQDERPEGDAVHHWCVCRLAASRWFSMPSCGRPLHELCHDDQGAFPSSTRPLGAARRGDANAAGRLSAEQASTGSLLSLGLAAPYTVICIMSHVQRHTVALQADCCTWCRSHYGIANGDGDSKHRSVRESGLTETTAVPTQRAPAVQAGNS